MYDFSTEIEGLSEILNIIAGPLLERDGEPSEESLGKAIFGAACYASYIATSVYNAYNEQWAQNMLNKIPAAQGEVQKGL